MKTKPIPAIIMLAAGLVACIAGIVAHMEIVKFTEMLLLVLILFYLLGGLVKLVLDRFFQEEKTEEATDGEEPASEEGQEATDAEGGKEEKE